jgi:hypothetical protein
MLWERWNEWTFAELPRLNRAVLAGSAPPERLTEEFRDSVLDDLPARRSSPTSPERPQPRTPGMSAASTS